MAGVGYILAVNVATAQVPPDAVGREVRVALKCDGVQKGICERRGVLDAAGDSLLIRPYKSTPVAVPLDQVQQMWIGHRSATRTLAGSAIGLTIGAVTGAMIASIRFCIMNGCSDPERGKGAAIGGTIGLVVGTIVGLSKPSWKAVNLTPSPEGRGVAVSLRLPL